jgi:hypothetical protein
MLLGLPAVISSLVSPRGQRLGDLAAGTVVVRERRAAGNVEVGDLRRPGRVRGRRGAARRHGARRPRLRDRARHAPPAPGAPGRRDARAGRRAGRVGAGARGSPRAAPGTSAETWLRCVAAAMQVRRSATVPVTPVGPGRGRGPATSAPPPVPPPRPSHRRPAHRNAGATVRPSEDPPRDQPTSDDGPPARGVASSPRAEGRPLGRPVPCIERSTCRQSDRSVDRSTSAARACVRGHGYPPVPGAGGPRARRRPVAARVQPPARTDHPPTRANPPRCRTR